MLEFKLTDLEIDKQYTIKLNFKDMDHFDEWCEDSIKFQNFLKKMTFGSDKWCADDLDDGCGLDDNGEYYTGYSSYEIKDFHSAIKMWEKFFKKCGKLIE